MTDIAETLVPGLAMHAAFRSWFGLPPASTRVLLALYQAAHPIAAERLAYHAQVGVRALVNCHLPALREALDSESIDHHPGAGYSLTEEGRAECRAVLWRLGEELRRAS